MTWKLVPAAVLLAAGCSHARNTAAAPAAGVRVSMQSVKGKPPGYYVDAASKISSAVTRAVPGVVWIVGVYQDDGSCRLSFPGGATVRPPHVLFSPADLNEPYLRAFDAAGIEVWLQVEPGRADPVRLIELVMERYSTYRCVKGVGIDVEWYMRSADSPMGAPVSDAAARQWLAAVRRSGPDCGLFLKHWRTDMLPAGERTGILFIDDSQGFRDMDAMLKEFKGWGAAFRTGEVAFQVGYPRDRDWWGKVSRPERAVTRRIFDEISNCAAVYWVDFTLEEVVPRTADAPPPDAVERP
ncbi:MAG: hypothetical protein JW909_08555 [Planctomycetes bacterium]|nr:hypothetical protein [Planctomycetota bacterium]